MVTRKEIILKIDEYLKGALSDQELDAWAFQALVREKEDYSLDGILTGQVLGLLNMLHDDDPSLRSSREELEEARNLLLGKKGYETKRLVLKDFSSSGSEFVKELRVAIDSLQHDAPPRLDKVVKDCNRAYSGTIPGLLIRQIGNLFEVASGAVRPGVVRPFVMPHISEGQRQIALTEIVRKLQDHYDYLTGQKPFLLTGIFDPAKGTVTWTIS